MRIFVYEHITGGGLLDQALPSALAQEGDLMLHALLRDLGEISGGEIITLRDARLPALKSPFRIYTPRSAAEAEKLMENCMHLAQAVWPIAPESGGVLERITRRVLAHGRRVLGSHPDAVRLTASKRETSRQLSGAGIAVVQTYSADEAMPDKNGKWVVKPDDGAGCTETRLFGNFLEAWRWINTKPDHYVLQPFHSGQAVSLCALCRNGKAHLLSCNDQHVEVRDGQFHFFGSVVNAFADRDGAFAEIATRIAAAIPGLWGYVGIDLVQSGSQLVVMEVNPRLTTSYAGLHEALGCNPAELVLDLLDDGKPFHLPEFSRQRIEVDIEALHA